MGVTAPTVLVINVFSWEAESIRFKPALVHVSLPKSKKRIGKSSIRINWFHKESSAEKKIGAPVFALATVFSVRMTLHADFENTSRSAIHNFPLAKSLSSNGFIPKESAYAIIGALHMP